MAYGMNRAAVMGGVGQGLEKAAGNIMNAFFMKQKLQVAQQVADAQKQKAQSDTRKTDAYINYLNNKDIAKRFEDMHGSMPAFMQALEAQAGKNGPGSTANQLATRYAPMPGESALSEMPPSAEGPGLPRGMARAQVSPAPMRSQGMPPPPVQSPAMPPIPAADPRNLVSPQPFDRPMFADDEA